MKRFVWLCSVVVVACSAPPMPSVDGGGEPVPDFSLRDENPNSALAATQVSPRDFAGKVTGWYFGHSS